jgi:predicted dehydrogenase
MYRVLFTGLGSIGSRHLRLLRERDESFDLHAFRSGATDWDSPDDVTDHDSLDAALAADPDIAFVTNPTALHVRTATKCARAGCDLFVEKPLSHTLDGVDELVRAATERDLITYVGCQLRFHPVLQAVKSALDDGEIGTVYSFRAYSGSYLPDWRPGQDYRDSYSADPDLGGGVVLDLIHEIDYSYWLFGDVSEQRAWTGQVSGLDVRTEDLAEILLETDSGAVGSIHLDYYRPEPRRTLEITGSDGLISADLNEGTLERRLDGEPSVERFQYERDDLFRSQHDYFLSHVRNREPCENDFPEGKRVLKIALKAKRQ